MPTDEQRQAEATRYVIYSLATMSVAIVLAAILLMTYSGFFK